MSPSVSARLEVHLPRQDFIKGVRSWPRQDFFIQVIRKLFFVFVEILPVFEVGFFSYFLQVFLTVLSVFIVEVFSSTSGQKRRGGKSMPNGVLHVLFLRWSRGRGSFILCRNR